METTAKNRRKAASRGKIGGGVPKEPGEGYREIAEKAVQGIIVLQDGKLRYANSRARNFFKKPIHELSPEALVNLAHPDDRSMIMDFYARRLRGEETPQVYSFRASAGDGRVLWLEFSVSLIEWEGRPATLVLAENITERKKMEAMVGESEQTIRALLNASPAVEFLVGPDGKILAHNRAFERLFGSDGTALTGRNIQELLSPEEIRVNRDKAVEVLSTGKPVYFEDYQRGVWFEKSFIPILDKEGRVAKLACHAVDISEKRRATEALKDNELRYRLLAENISDYIWATDRNLRPTYVSPGVTRLLGYTPEELMAMKLEDLLTPGSLPLVWKAYTQEKTKEAGAAKGQPQPQVLVLEYRRKDGSSFWAETRSRPVFDSEGKTVAVVGITLDISGRRESEAKLRESERRYRLLAENVTDVIWTMEKDLRLTYLSPGVTRAMGYTPEEVMAGPLEKFLSSDSWALVQGAYAEELAEEMRDPKDLSRVRTLEMEMRRKDGSLVWGESRITTLRDAEGKIVEFLGVTRDITERKKAEQTARRLAEEDAVMAEISRVISDSMNIEEIYERFAREVKKLIEFDNITIGMMNPEDGSVAITHVFGVPVPGREKGTSIPLEGSAAGEVYKTGSSLLVHKGNLDKAVGKIPKLSAAFESGMRSMILVPLIREARVIGVLVVLSSRPDAYSRSQVEIAERVAAHIAGAIANARLFQELRRTVEALKESEVRNRTLVEAAAISGLGIVGFKNDERGRVLCQFANEEAQRISGYTEEELGQIPFQEIVHPAHREAALRQYRTRAAGDQQPVLYQLPIRHKKGHTVLIEVSAIRTVFRGEETMIGFFRDISERKRTEEALKESEAKFRELFQNANDLIFLHPMIDNQTPGQFIEVNDLACRKLGYTREELLRLSPQDITFEFKQSVSSVGEGPFIRAKDSGLDPHLTFEMNLVAKSGEKFPVEMSLEIFLLQNQRFGLGIARDITERKKAEQEMIDHQAHLEEMVRDRTARIQELEQQRGEVEKMAATGVLAARIAHEINNPLAGIKGSFMLIQDAIPKDHPYHHYIARIHREIKRIARVVRQMFELYRAPEEDPEEWELDQMIQDVVALLKDEARERKVAFQLPVLPVKVQAPAGPTRQVLFNVIKNAVEASPLEGRVRVSVQGGEKKISIQVADEGPGISEKNRVQVFKPFFSTKKGRQKGLGLGLSISKEIVESLGGSIRLQNLRGKGLLCQIDFPKRKAKKENGDD